MSDIAEYVRPGICACCGAGGRLVWPPHAIIQAAQAFNALHGRPPVSHEWRHGTAEWPASSTVSRVFGRWNVMLEAAGLERRRKQGGPLNWTKDAVAEAMLDHLLGTGRWPTDVAWKRGLRDGEHRPSTSTVRLLFGTWNAAKRYAGWDGRIAGTPNPARKLHQCVGCACDLDTYSIGCRVCTGRRTKRRLRKDSPVVAPVELPPLLLVADGGAAGEHSCNAMEHASSKEAEAA